MPCKFLLQARTAKLGIHAYDCLILGCYIYLLRTQLCLFHDLSYSCNARLSVPMSMVFLILLFTINISAVTIAAFILLLLLLFYCCHLITVTTDKLLRENSFLGVVELTTQLLRLINILWLPLCRINKLGLYYPRRLLRSPTLVGHHSSLFLC